MPHASLFEKPRKIKAKRTAKGHKNPRYVSALRAEKELKEFQDELDYTVFSKARIKREYTEERVSALLAKAQENLKNMTMLSIRPPWMPQE